MTKFDVSERFQWATKKEDADSNFTFDSVASGLADEAKDPVHKGQRHEGCCLRRNKAGKRLLGGG
jgi:hypothetical protein